MDAALSDQSLNSLILLEAMCQGCLFMLLCIPYFNLIASSDDVLN